MPRLRFETVRDLLEAFPIAEPLIEVAPSDEPSLPLLEGLVAREDWDRGVGFCAFLLPRREAVWWGCRTVRALLPTRRATRKPRSRAAEEWVQRPEDDRRLAALELGMRGNSELRRPIWRLPPAGRAGASTSEARHRFRSRPSRPRALVRAALLVAARAWNRSNAGDSAALPGGRHPARLRRNAGGLTPWASR